MINVEDMYNDPCSKLDSWCVDAFFELKLTPSDSAELTLDNSWNTTSVDLTPAVKAAETVTHLFLSPEDNPTALQFNREDYGRDEAQNGGVDCISGDTLSRIISMKLLKDVSQTTAPASGDVYMYDGNLFQPYNMQTFIDATNTTLEQHTQQIAQWESSLLNLTRVVANNYTALTNRIDQLQQQVSDLETRLAVVEATVAKPSWAPSDSRLIWGNINDTYNASPTTKGLYGHNPATNVVGDQRFQ